MRAMRRVAAFRAAVGMALLLGSAAAGAATLSFRCKNDLVNVGDSKASAQLKCGEPVAKDNFCEAPAAVPTQVPVPNKGVVVVGGGSCEIVDEWTYNPGYGQFMTTLRFESGRLVTMSYGDRVK